MKRILATLIVAIAPLHADVLIEQKVESAYINGNMVVKIKGDQVRMDMPPGLAGAITVLADSKTGTMTTFIHEKKEAAKLNIADAVKKAEQAQKAAGIDPAKIEKPKTTGQKEKVGEWEAEIFEYDGGPGTKGKVWVAKDFPNYKSIADQMHKMYAAMGSVGFDPSKFDLGGMVVKTETSTQAGKMTTTILKVTEEVIPDTEFKAPEGYKDAKSVGLGGQ